MDVTSRLVSIYKLLLNITAGLIFFLQDLQKDNRDITTFRHNNSYIFIYII